VSSSELLCWGANDVGQLGDGTTTSRARATTVPVLEGGSPASLERVVAGRRVTCVLTFGGRLLCAGRNASGETGTALAPGGAVTTFSPVRDP
jgi:serine/threonine-protein kinase